MATSKKPIASIPALYRSVHEDIAIFYWVEGQRRIIPGITIEQSLGMWIEYVGGEGWDIYSLRITYNRMQRKYYDSSKT